MKRNPYTINTGYVKCIKEFSMGKEYFIKGDIYKYCFSDSTVYCPHEDRWLFVGLKYPEVFRKINIFDIIKIVIVGIYRKIFNTNKSSGI